MLFDFFKDFVNKYNIKNGELASQKNLNASVNILKREVNNLYNRDEIKRGLLALEWQTETLYEEGEIASFNGTNYIVIKGQQSINELPNESYKWRETLRSEWTLNLDPNGYLNKNNNTEYIPKNPYNPATKQYVDNGNKIIYRNQNLSDGINFIPLDNTSLSDIEYIVGNELPSTDKNYIAPFVPTASWQPANKLYVDTQIQELASGGSIVIGKTLNSDALGLRPASAYLTLEREFSGNYNGFAVKNGPAKDNINAIDWLRTTANGLLPYKPYDVGTQDGSNLGSPEWKFKDIYSVSGNFNNIISDSANIDTITTKILNVDNFKLTNIDLSLVTATNGNFTNINTTAISADLFNGIKSTEFSQISANEIINGSRTWNNEILKMTNLPTSDPKVKGQLWNNSGVPNISAG